MIDIHTHILPGVDDGAASMEEALQMARMAVAGGVDTLFLTPHCNVGYLYENYYDDKMERYFRNFEHAVREQRLPLTILSGMEVFGSLEVPELLMEGKLITLNHSRYLLMEFGFDIDKEWSAFLLQEILSLGFRPVIAHPERYPIIQKYPEIAGEWVELGCAIQVNKGSILGNFGRNARETAFMLLDQRLASLVASDSHGLQRRTPGLFEVYHVISNHFSSVYADILMRDNPKRVIEDKELIEVSGIRSLL